MVRLFYKVAEGYDSDFIWSKVLPVIWFGSSFFCQCGQFHHHFLFNIYAFYKLWHCLGRSILSLFLFDFINADQASCWSHTWYHESPNKNFSVAWIFPSWYCHEILFWIKNFLFLIFLKLILKILCSQKQHWRCYCTMGSNYSCMYFCVLNSCLVW